MNWGSIIAFAIGAAAGVGAGMYWKQQIIDSANKASDKLQEGPKGYVNGASFTTGMGYPGFAPARPDWATRGQNQSGRTCTI